MSDSRMVSDQQRDSEQGVREVSSALFNRVTNYHAQIGANVNKETLQSLEWQLLSEAKALFHRKEYEESLNTFTHCLAVTEKTRSSRDATVRGAIVHNIASCLHHLGELEAAQVRGKRPHPPTAPIALAVAPAAVPPREARRAAGRKSSRCLTPPLPLPQVRPSGVLPSFSTVQAYYEQAIPTPTPTPNPKQAYYEQAIQAFEKAKTPFLERMMYAMQWLGRP